jgi:hypothetical protein
VPQSQVVSLVMAGAVEAGGGLPEGALGVALIPDLVQRAVRVAGLGRPALGCERSGNSPGAVIK